MCFETSGAVSLIDGAVSLIDGAGAAIRFGPGGHAVAQPVPKGHGGLGARRWTCQRDPASPS